MGIITRQIPGKVSFVLVRNQITLALFYISKDADVQLYAARVIAASGAFDGEACITSFTQALKSS
jgi:hypothetical protein